MHSHDILTLVIRRCISFMSFLMTFMALPSVSLFLVTFVLSKIIHHLVNASRLMHWKVSLTLFIADGLIRDIRTDVEVAKKSLQRPAYAKFKQDALFV